MHRSPRSRAWSAADPPSELASGSVVIINPDRSDSGRSRNDVDSGARDASIIRPSDDNGRSAGNTPGSSRAYPVDIPGPRKLEIRLLLILWAPERRVRRPPAQAICIFSSYWLFWVRRTEWAHHTAPTSGSGWFLSRSNMAPTSDLG